MADAGSRNPTSGGIGQLTHFHENGRRAVSPFSLLFGKVLDAGAARAAKDVGGSGLAGDHIPRCWWVPSPR